MGRHDVHSPSIYSLLDESLRGGKARFSLPEFRNENGDLWKGDYLLLRFLRHFQIPEIILFNENGTDVFRVKDSKNTHSEELKFESLWIFETPQELNEKFDSLISRVNSETIIVVQNIHERASSDHYWEALQERAQVRASLDFFRLGVLMFSHDFREKQRFVLKYPA
jgi:hypothetical protein